MNVLSATTTKRDAKSYISRFNTADRAGESPDLAKNVGKSGTVYPTWSLDRLGINIGALYATTRAVEQTPRFSQHNAEKEVTGTATDHLHIALVKIRGPHLLSDDTVKGIGSTLSQLAKLGLTSVVVLDCDEIDTESSLPIVQWRDQNLAQADRVVSAINAHQGPRGRCVADAIGFSCPRRPSHSTVQRYGRVGIQFPKLFDAALQQGILPVVSGIAYTTDTQRAIRVPADHVLLALTRGFIGIDTEVTTDNHSDSIYSVEKIIILDPLGGTPSLDHSKTSQVFINLEQEFQTLCHELEKRSDGSQHTKNLELVENTLTFLPPMSSALITTPEEAARSANLQNLPEDPLGVSTRPVKNPLIHNLLTDKPAFSSSLPPARIGIHPNDSSTSKPLSGTSTFIKRGMPLSIIPDPHEQAWTPPPSSANGTSLDLEDPQIAFPRLVHLIEDSFARRLNVRHYLDRIRHHIAGVIIAGEYEGGAVLTWEAPPSALLPDPSSSFSSSPTTIATAADLPSTRLVPYLDKFAVLQRSQGSGASVADIVFKAMVRDCFPAGVVWRSRMTNPVNKWYFERAVGTWKIPGTNWCMFWTTPGIFGDERDRRWEDYVDVCRNVKASWADDKAAD